MHVHAGNDKATRKGQVLTLLAEQALQCLDFKTSYIHCQDLMAAGMSDTDFIMVHIMAFPRVAFSHSFSVAAILGI